LLLLPLCLLACHKSDPITPAAGEIGAACAEESACNSAFCLADPSFPENYCTLDCAADGVCPEGAVCQDYLTYKFCLDACAGDEECRGGYVCDYGTCRPPCNRDDACTKPDLCMQGRCKAGCTDEADCTDGKRCQGGKCVAPCKKDTDCVPGNTCDTATGGCVPKPGKKMGEACGNSAECATAYCLPTRKICSVKCTASTGCPTGYVCGLETFDKDGAGTPDSAEADCVPVKGKAAAGATCAKDDDCSSAHCYYGFCMEGCAADADCGALQCVDVKLLLAGGVPTYKGCLPRTGVSTYTLGTFTPGPYGEVRGFDVPPNAASFVLSAEVTSTTEVPLIVKLQDPTGAVLNEMKDQCDFYSQPDRYFYGEQYSSIYVPNTPAVTLKPGIHTYTVATSGTGLAVTTRLQLKLGKAQKGTFGINWYFLNIAGTCVPGATLNAASAPTHAWFAKLRNNMSTILQSAGLTVGAQTYQDLKNPALDSIELSTTGVSTELQQLFASSAGKTGSSINIFLVRSIGVGGMMGGVILGIAGGIPGPLAVHGKVHSGIGLSMETACFEQYGYNPGHTMAHEIGHYLGLFHNQESEDEPGHSGGKITCACPCGQYMSCWNGQWCRGEDPIPDTTTSQNNLMYYAAESTQMFEGNQLTAGQLRVLLDNPLVGH